MSEGATIEQLWRSLGAGLLAWFRARGADEAAAEDLLSETFLRVQRSLDRVQDDARYAAWVRRIARNVWVDQLRARGETVELEDAPDAPEESDALAEAAGWLGPAIDGLEDELTATILRRTELAGETQARVAQDLGLGLGAVKARVRRGRRKLRERLEACCSFEFDRRGGLLETRRRGDDCAC